MRRLIPAVLALAFAGGCAVQTRAARAVQPNPAIAHRESGDLPISLKLYIYQRDMHLPRDYQLRSWAQFAVVARDRLRFHVGIVRYDEAEAETSGWEVWLEDDSGRRFPPAKREVPRMNRIVMAWRLYPYAPGDSWCPKPPCLSRVVPGYEVYEGQADYVFQDPEILSPERKELSLVLRRGQVEYRYDWRFGEATAVEHYGRSKTDDELGTIAVPGPNTELAGTRYEWDKW